MAAEVPWWSNLVAVLGTAVVSVLGTVYFLKGGKPGTPGAPGAPGFGGLLKQVMLYLPHIILMFGVLADMFTMQGVYSIPSLLGLLALPLSFVLKYLWSGVGETIGYIVELVTMRKTANASAASKAAEAAAETATKIAEGATSGVGTAAKPLSAVADVTGGPGSRTRAQAAKTAEEAAAYIARQKGGANDYDGCTVYGLQFLQSPYAPQTLVVTATVFWYYILDLITNRGPASASVSIGFFIAFFVGELFLIGECTPADATVKINRWLKGVIAMAEGLLIGGTGYAIVQAYYPTSLPSTVIPTTPRVSVDSLTPNADGTLSDPDTGLSYVMVNGIPTLNTCSVMDGSGVPALPGSCPANTQSANTTSLKK
jgi:hypothetical protein